MAQNPNINFTSGNSTINVKGTIINASKLIGDPLTYSAGKPVDANSKDPIIKRLKYTIDVNTGQVKYVDTEKGITANSLNDYAKSLSAVMFSGYDAFTTQNIQYAMQKNLAVEIGAQGPAGGPPAAPSGGGGGLFDFNIDDLKKNLNFGYVDTNLKKINLQYPKDALYNNTQDYLQIGQYHYKPPKSDQLFGGTAGAKEIITSGLQKTSALADFLGIVKLPMPNNVTDSNNVSWGDDNMNNLSAAATAEILGNLGSYAAAGGTAALISALVGTGANQGASLGVQGAMLSKLLSAASNSQGAQALLKTAGASKILSMAGFSVSPESILARGFGVVPNSNLELLFNSPTLREFTFQYRLSPRSKEEANEVNKIIRFFKQGMAAKKQNSTSGNATYGLAGAASYFLGTPNVFQLQYKTSGGNPIKGVNRIKTCALTGFAMNYAADGNWAAYDEGQPVSVIMNMSFKELEPIYDTDYQENIFEGRKFTGKDNSGDLYPIYDTDYQENIFEGRKFTGKDNSGDLYPISDDEVGY